MHKARIIKARLSNHPNADRLQILNYNGLRIIVGLDTQEKQLGVFFETDLQLSEQFCKQNNLYRESSLNADKTKKGFFEKNRRIRAQPFRGIKSQGFWCPLSYLEWTGYDTCKLSEGDEFDKLNGHPICTKYYSPATIRVRQSRQAKTKAKKEYLFPKHRDTEHLHDHIGEIPDSAIIYVSEKLHGTSHRIGNVLVKTQHKSHWYHRLWNALPLPNHQKEVKEYKIVVGTRNTIADWITPGNTNEYRLQVTSPLDGKLRKGEVIYGEIVGFNSHNAPIMNTQSTSKLSESFQELYGEQMMYTYDCTPNDDEKPQFDFYVYRIVYLNPDGFEYELPQKQMEYRAKELELKTVPTLEKLDGEKKVIRNRVSELIDGPSVIDPSHIREGIVLRIETPERTYFLKEKNYEFKVMEGILKEQDDYVDAEEAA